MKPALGESLWPSCWLYQNFPFSYIGRPLDGHSSGYPFSPKFLNPPRPRLFNNWFVKTTSPCMSQWCLKDLGLNTIKKKSLPIRCCPITELDLCLWSHRRKCKPHEWLDSYLQKLRTSKILIYEAYKYSHYQCKPDTSNSYWTSTPWIGIIL